MVEPKHVESLKQQNARLRKAIKDKLGRGVWGLDKKESFTHEEILFLFARVFSVFGIDYITNIRTSYPDCICVKDGQQVGVEFEPILSAFSDHIRKDDLSKCQYVVCWIDDVESRSPMREEMRRHNIGIIELKSFYDEGKVKPDRRSFEWSLKDIQSLTVNQLKVLDAFVAEGQDILTLGEISEFIRVTGRALGGIIGGFTTGRASKDWIIRRHPKGWQFNKAYRQKVKRILKEFGPDIGIT